MVALASGHSQAPPIPRTVTDPVQSLRPWPVAVSIAGHWFTIPAMCATDWLVLLMTDRLNLTDVLFGLLDEGDAEVVAELVLDGSADFADLEEACLDVIEAACARRWWVALRLVSVMRASWPVLGATMLRRGIDANRLSISGWLDVALLLIFEAMKDEEATLFALKLEQPPPGAKIEESEMEMDAATFMTMA